MRIETVEGFLASKVNPHRWRLSGSFLAHLFEATTQQHHRALAATIIRLVPRFRRVRCRGACWANVAVLPMALGANSGLGALTLPVKSRGGIGFGPAHLGTPGNRWDAIAH